MSQVKRWFCTAVAAVAVVFFAAGCHHPGADIPEAHPGAWTPTEIENTLGGSDPLENFNRSMFSCTDAVMNYVADPLGRVYTTVFPRFFVEHLHNVCLNLEYPARLLSCLLQAEWGAAGDESIRFFTNTTLGIAGIFDVAWEWWKIPSSRAGFGQTFARWGIGPGETFMLPLLPAISGRDMTGLLFDAAFDGKTYIPYAGSATALNRMVMMHRNYMSITEDAIDPYKNFRFLMLLNNEISEKLWYYHKICRDVRLAQAKRRIHIPAEPFPKPAQLKGRWLDLNYYNSQGPMADTLRLMLFQVQKKNESFYMPLSFFNSDFPNQGSIRKVQLVASRDEKIRYCYYEAPEREDKAPVKERLVLLLPGIGGSCTTENLTAFAEMFHNAGCKVAGFDSTFNWHFISADSRCRLPGYLPDDALRVRRVLRAALDDLKQAGKIKEPEIILAGYSLGGIQTLKIADLEAKEPVLGISRFVAVNPPVSLKHALKHIDHLASISAGWSKSEMKKRLVEDGGRLLLFIGRQMKYFDMHTPAASILAHGYLPEIDPESAAFIVGLYLKMSVRDLLLAAHREKALPDLPEYKWGSRNKLYQAVDKITLADYAAKYLLPTYPQKTLDELFYESDLRSLEKNLKNSPAVRVIHSYDDFLLTPQDRVWLDETFGDKLLWLSRGAHLGGLYYKAAAEEMLRAGGVAE